MENINSERPKKKETKSRKFWRIVFGTMVGFILMNVIVSFISLLLFVIVIAAVGTSDISPVKENSILKIDLGKPIAEQSEENPFDIFGDEFSAYYQSSIGLDDILASIKHAGTDPKIKGIYINSPVVSCSWATLKEIHDALLEFKESGKFIYAYADNYSQGGYYLSSVADQVNMSTTGNITFKGIAMQVTFYKELIEKLDIDVQIIRHGKFKSAVEPYFMDKMSEANREQMTLLANTLWKTAVEDMSATRNLSAEELNVAADNLFLGSATKAQELKLVDKLCYKTDVISDLMALVNINDEDDLHLTSLGEYRKSFTMDKSDSENKIAVIYAVGQIVNGKSGSGNMGSESTIKLIRDAYSDDNVKAIVLRINSPGGDGTASDIIWHEIEMAKKAGKKVVTSMGDYAASGGYYIACNSDYIIAQPNTLTGSIGVFGMVPSFQRALKNKLGVTFDVVKTNSHADAASLIRALDEDELAAWQGFVDDFYGVFTKRVADGRGMTQAAVDSIGQGRVWAGADAINIGLVDQLGNIDDAIAKAAELAGIKDYNLSYYPEKKNVFTELLKDTKEEQSIQAAVKNELGDFFYIYQGLHQLKEAEGVQALIPFQIKFE